MIRAASDDELGYLRATWVRGMLRGDKKSSAASKARTRETIDALLTTQRALVMVVGGTSRTEDVVAWCCYTPLKSTAIVHYVYVRKERDGECLRRRGIARTLIQRAGVDTAKVIPYTHETPDWRALVEACGWSVAFISPRDVLI